MQPWIEVVKEIADNLNKCSKVLAINNYKFDNKTEKFDYILKCMNMELAQMLNEYQGWKIWKTDKTTNYDKFFNKAADVFIFAAAGIDGHLIMETICNFFNNDEYTKDFKEIIKPIKKEHEKNGLISIDMIEAILTEIKSIVENDEFGDFDEVYDMDDRIEHYIITSIYERIKEKIKEK